MVAELFDWVHSVDRTKIAQRLQTTLESNERNLEVLLEVNVSGEASKEGYDLSKWPDGGDQFKRFSEEIAEIVSLSRLRYRGLMTMAPYTEDTEMVRGVFRRLRELRDAVKVQFPEHPWDHLSMGMSSDYEIAIEEGATIVRVGTAIFGPRRYPA